MATEEKERESIWMRGLLVAV